MIALFKQLGLSSGLRRQLVYAFALLPVFVGVCAAAFLTHFNGGPSLDEQHAFMKILLLTVVVKLAVFGRFRVFQSWNRYVTFHDLIALTCASTVSMILVVLGDLFFLSHGSFPAGVLILDWLATIVALGGLRSVVRFVSERQRLLGNSNETRPVFIIGADDWGELLLRAIRGNRRLPYQVVGFLEECRDLQGTFIGGVPVLGSVEETFQLAGRHGVAEVLVAAGRLPGKKIRQLLEAAHQHGIPVKMLPNFEQLLDGQLALTPREVSIEDLLRREPVVLDLPQIRNWVDDQVVLVTGSSGSIGSEICRQLLQFSARRLVLVDRSETGQFFLERRLRQLAPQARIEICLADVNDALRMHSIFARHRPDIVFHAAAYKHVPLLEDSPGEAVKNITAATRVMADLARQACVKSFVLISTDKAVRPSSVMGCCKRLAEQYVTATRAASHTRFMVVRFGNVLGSSGSVVPIFREQIAAGGPLTITHPEMMRYFMTIPEAAQLVIQAGMMGRGGETFVLDMGEPIRIVDLATDMVRLSGLRLGEDIELTFVGTRPGEKLFEELVVHGEEHIATPHPKIIAVKGIPGGDVRLGGQIDRLVGLADGPNEVIVEELQRLQPDFRRDENVSLEEFRRAG